MEGPGAHAVEADDAERAALLGLPQSGPGSLAEVRARFVALVIDWAASLLAASLFVPWGDPRHSLVTLAVFGIEAMLGVALAGASFGQRMRKLRVRRVGADMPPGLLAALIRTALLVLVVPALLPGRDGRGLHDRLAGTVLVRG